MVSLSMVKNHALPVHLPAAATGAPQDRADFAAITITDTGGVFFNKEPVTPEQLDAALRDLLASRPDPKIFINGDSKAEFGRAIAVLDQVRRLGITKIAIETQPKPAAP